MTTIGRGTHGDQHDLWIDPDDPQHIVLANDGGGTVTFNVASRAADVVGAGLPDRPVLPRRHDEARAVSRLRRAAGQQRRCACRATRALAARWYAPTTSAVAAARRQRPAVAPYPVGGSEDGYIAPDPKDVDVFFSGGNNGSFTHAAESADR